MGLPSKSFCRLSSPALQHRLCVDAIPLEFSFVHRGMAATDSSSGEGFISEEASVVRMLQRLKPNSLTMRGLEKAYRVCQTSNSHLTMVYLADILFHIVNLDLQEFFCEVENALEMLDEAKSEGERREKDDEERKEEYKDMYIHSIVDWVFVATTAPPPIDLPTLRDFVELGYSLAQAYDNPCNSQLGTGPDSLLTWAELQDAASTFMAVRRPCIADALPVIHCLIRKPLLNCRGLSAAESANLAKFDEKWEQLLKLYPVINMLADPPLVVVEPLFGAGLPPQVAGVVAAITTAANSPLPSGGAPVQVNDVVGSFNNVFQMQSLDDARTFAAMLRGQMADATGGGGAGPGLHILAFNAPPGSFRLY